MACGWIVKIQDLREEMSRPAQALHALEQAEVPEEIRTVRMLDRPCGICGMPAVHTPCEGGGVDMACMVCPAEFHESRDGGVRATNLKA